MTGIGLGFLAERTGVDQLADLAIQISIEIDFIFVL